MRAAGEPVRPAGRPGPAINLLCDATGVLGGHRPRAPLASRFPHVRRALGLRCVGVWPWALDDKRVPGKPSAAYAERDDANMTVKVSSVGTLLSIHWSSVPAARVVKNFGARDYCGEISRTRKLSAALWLTTTTESPAAWPLYEFKQGLALFFARNTAASCSVRARGIMVRLVQARAKTP